MKTGVIAASAIAVLLLAGVTTVAFAHLGLSSTTIGSPNTQGNDNRNQQSQQTVTQSDHESDNGGDHEGGARQACSNLTVGEVLAVSGLEGHFINASNAEIHGNASGTFTFKVTQIYAEGCTLSITGGSFKLGSTTYTVTGGSVILNRGGHSGEGMGTTSGGTFLIRIDGLQGTSKSADVGQIRLDFKNGSQEFLANLGSPESEE